jgi:conjugative transfer signal peptidase TraF
LLAIGLALVLIAAPHCGVKMILVWNASPSVPIGLYLIVQKPMAQGEIALINLPPPMAALADARGYLPRSAYLLKPIRALGGDRVCRIGLTLFVNGRPVGAAPMADIAGRALPRWSGCRHLRDDDIFFLGRSANSFDSRYFGPLNINTVVGRAQPLWILND